MEGSTIQIRSKAKNGLVRWLKEQGLPQGDTVSRIVEWFLEQKPLMKQVVTKRITPEMGSTYADAIKQLAHDPHQVATLKTTGTKGGPEAPGEHSRAQNKGK